MAPLKDNSILTADPTEKANILNKQYQSVFTQDNDGVTDNFPPLKRQLPIMNDIKVRHEGVEKTSSATYPFKAGPDALPPSTLNELASDIAPVMQIIFQSSLDHGTLPIKWVNANISSRKEKNIRQVITDLYHSPVFVVKLWNT